MKIWKIISLFLGIIIALGTLFYFFLSGVDAPVLDEITSFSECARLYPVAESYPRQCHTPDGKMFMENIGNELEKSDLIRVASPRPNAEISSPVMIEGEARGYWYFEASFPIKILDANGAVLLQTHAEAKSDWMTEDFVRFSVLVDYPKPTTPTGEIVLEKDNPSGLYEHADEIRIPVRFTEYAVTSMIEDNGGKIAIGRNGCIIGGCSNEICAEEAMGSGCVVMPEHACYRTAICEPQEDGKCGWTNTKELHECLVRTGGRQ